jgi:hypothetical protein
MREVTESEREYFRVVIGTIILASARLSKLALLDLLQIRQAVMDFVLVGLRSVIRVPDRPDGFVHAFHSSFHDFLVKPKDDNPSWFIDNAKYHGVIAKSCLKRMGMNSDGLKKDICNLQKHTTKNRDVEVQAAVKSLPSGLAYASRYWAGHFAKSKPDDELLTLLNDFVLEHLLHWIEILCLLGCLSEGVDALRTTIQSLKVGHRPFPATMHS